MTGREILKKIAGEAAVAALYDHGFVCVPRVLTKEMLKDAYWSAPGEDLGYIWEELITSAEAAKTEAENLDQ